MKIQPMRAIIAIFATALMVVLAFGIHSSHQRSFDLENVRLKRVAEAQLEELSLPPGSNFVYQEVEVSHICKTAKITRLFSIDDLPESVCKDILLPEGWVSHGGCQLNTYPYKRAPAHGDMPSYNYITLSTQSLKNDFRIGVTANPKNAWGPIFELLPVGKKEAIPLARKSGATFYTINIRYTEDFARVKRHCPENLSHCDCSPATLYEWRFADGRMRSLSN
ncbi:hypothetical protein ABE501_02355 [Comamonas testosteroni]